MRKEHALSGQSQLVVHAPQSPNSLKISKWVHSTTPNETERHNGPIRNKHIALVLKKGKDNGKRSNSSSANLPRDVCAYKRSRTCGISGARRNIWHLGYSLHARQQKEHWRCAELFRTDQFDATPSTISLPA